MTSFKKLVSPKYWSDFYKSHQVELIYWLAISFVTCINLIISQTVRSSDIFFVPNRNPIGFSFGYISSATILVFITWATFEFKLLEKSPISLIFILGGIYSNFWEKALWGSVADYLHLYLLNFNIADLQIVCGLVWLNIQIFFGVGKLNEILRKEYINEVK